MPRPSIRVCIAILALELSGAAQDSRPAAAKPAPANPPATSVSPVHAFDAKRMDGTTAKLSEYSGKVLLVVNTASKCGLTPQYEGLEKLQKTYEAKGFTVLAFPANDFGKQEPGTNEEIAKFCTDKYSVTFPVFAKVSVKGADKAPLYEYLTSKSPFPGEIQWNFQKFLVDRSGTVVARFEPGTKPADPKLTAAIESALTAATAKGKPQEPTKGDAKGPATRPAK